MSKQDNSKQDGREAGQQIQQAVENLAFDEVGGRATPPNRLDEILQRAAADAGEPPGMQQSNPFKVGKLWAAALLVLGLGTTIAASILERDDAGHGAKHDAAAITTAPDGNLYAGADQDPQSKSKSKSKPKPTPKQDPKPGGKQDPKPADKNGGLPKGTDPADLAVIRSAEAMLEAEKNLRRLMKDGKIAGVDQVLPFDQLSGWKYTEGLAGMPKKIKQLDGKKVLMLGFMLPIDEVTDITEFLLVESLWSCCYGQPPDINGIARVVMPKGKTLDYQFEPLKLVGTLEIEATVMDGYCVDIYQLHADYVEVIDAAKPKNVPPTKEELKKLEQEREKRKKSKKENGC